MVIPKFSSFATNVLNDRYAHTLPDGRKETWSEICWRVVTNVFGAVNAPKWMVQQAYELMVARKFIPGGRYLYASGNELHQTQNCGLVRAEDTREGWAECLYKSTMTLMSGAGLGVVYSELREEGAFLRRMGGYSSGPIPLMNAVNEVGRSAKSGGSRRAAIWGGLRWNHPDVFKFIVLKNWSPEVEAAKAKDFNAWAPMDHTNISVVFDDDFLTAYAAGDTLAHQVYWAVVRQSCMTGDPGFSMNFGVNAGEDLRNACCEITSRDDSDICNLGSINLANIQNENEMRMAVELGTAFLLAGTVYSDVPYAKVREVREKNRRLGLGLMGVHEWLLKNNRRYGDKIELLDIYATSGEYAAKWAKEWNLSCPTKTRGVAPVGTIGIIGETSTGIEPLFCVAYQRRRYNHGTRVKEFVVDPTARRLIAEGVDPSSIEDAYSLSHTVERRIAFQSYVQSYVDHAISSTINMPKWGSLTNNEDPSTSFGTTLMKYLPTLRGITTYPDGARSGQPLEPVDLAYALRHEGEVIEEAGDVCSLKGGSCGA